MKASQIIVAACIAGTALLSSTGVIAKTAKVAVSQIVEHPALDATRQGLLDGLKEKGYEEGKNLDFEYRTAQGNPAIAVQIARQFVGENPDVLVGIATPTAQALVSSTRSIPVVFTAVTDPVGAKLVSQHEKPGKNVTGLSDLSPVAQHVDLIKEILPNAKSIGVVYNPGEANAVTLVELLKEAAESKGFKVVEATALKSADVQSATQAISAKSDVIYAPTDNTVASAIEGMIVAANQAKTPVLGGATSYVEKGAVASLGFDYYQVGVQTADYVAAILEGADPGSLDVKVAKGSDLVVNKSAAEKIGITIPQSILDRATSVK
ncbi:ABC transporter substrate-binding protein [Vibrio nigripulchritudo ATCC 27043]|uniref:ABC-type transport system, periplasmic component n=2 Tax=Vibrio nigripulchritudo TaxID=28173 RepID=A0AAV2VVR3_9VIBR|nr:MULTISPECIES: ABC transporter substrate-binding protein [Vibrio]EGU55945.1 ABC transporter substrate-binding protein [Vibrio nigripulchritudo ATCC 27043]KJY81229.1 ABC transporter substrate-binding protein [Vibrio nigripulchritudo]UAB69371.1 ABC transporter substrate-binding protein [Vibrio sp. SCSIO 43132]CCN35680.1 putative ABC-type transport system, periplasmic component [Vibrio nigripulchritudo AM115]CCN43657.1 putative ABC-type transport system, periplasmic component [Vibrio nigripulch